MTENIVELIRRFAPISSRSRNWDTLIKGSGKTLRWHELEDERRVLIIADPGAGKTFEARTRARKLRERGWNAFFIRIEAIDTDFEQAFEIGSAEAFNNWLGSTGEAWFSWTPSTRLSLKPRAPAKMQCAYSAQGFTLPLSGPTFSLLAARTRGARCLTKP